MGAAQIQMMVRVLIKYFSGPNSNSSSNKKTKNTASLQSSDEACQQGPLSSGVPWVKWSWASRRCLAFLRLLGEEQREHGEGWPYKGLLTCLVGLHGEFPSLFLPLRGLRIPGLDCILQPEERRWLTGSWTVSFSPRRDAG